MSNGRYSSTQANCRYLLQTVPFKNVSDETEITNWRIIFEGLLDRLQQIENVALSLVSAASPEGYTSAETVPEFEGQSLDGDDEEGMGGASFVGPHGQLLAVCAWLSIKEVALLLGSVIDTIPLPLPNQQNVLLTEKSVERAGVQYMHILLTSRHRGAIEKSHMGFQVTFNYSKNLLGFLTNMHSRCYARTFWPPPTLLCIHYPTNGCRLVFSVQLSEELKGSLFRFLWIV